MEKAKQNKKIIIKGVPSGNIIDKKTHLNKEHIIVHPPASKFA